MKTIVAALLIAAVVAHGRPVFASVPESQPAANQTPGPLLKASFRPRFEVKPRPRQDAQDARDGRSWVERHPVWTGAIAGFGAVVGWTYLMTEPGGIPSRDGPALVWGGVGAGVGALIGWSIGRNRDDDYSANRRYKPAQR